MTIENPKTILGKIGLIVGDFIARLIAAILMIVIVWVLAIAIGIPIFNYVARTNIPIWGTIKGTFSYAMASRFWHVIIAFWVLFLTSITYKTSPRKPQTPQG